MGIQDVIAISIALVAVVFAGRQMWRSMSGTEGCSSCCGPSKKKGVNEVPTLQRTPLVHLKVAEHKDQ